MEKLVKTFIVAGAVIKMNGKYLLVQENRPGTNVHVNIVIRRIGENNGQFHFWSVMPHWTLSNNKRIIGSKKLEDE